jgi:DegV family protein with EDD domain
VIGIVTDSSSQITPGLTAEFGVEVVPLTVTIDGEEFHEGVDLDADGFYDRYADRRRRTGAAPVIVTSQPSPGQFSMAYRRLAERGCDEIVSIHISAEMSGTSASASIAARTAGVPVDVIDTGSASFGVSACVWAAGAAIASGAGAVDVRAAVVELVPRIGTAFMIGVPLLADRGGRAADIVLDGDGVPVLAMSGGRLDVLGRVATVEDTIDVMSTYAVGWSERVGGPVTVAVGVADAPSRPLVERLTASLSGLASVTGMIEYRVGPSVAAHTGPGTFGLFVFPTP